MTIALLTALALAAQQRMWRPQERVLITAFNEVGAITRDQRRIYMLSSGAISIYDFVARRWELPITLEDGVPPNDLPTAAEYEPVAGELWVGTRSGLLYRHRAVPFRVEVVTGGLGTVDALVALPAVDDYVYARTNFGWFRIRRTSISAQSVPAGAVPAEVMRAAAARATFAPGLRAFDAVLGLDGLNRRWPLTGYVSGERPDEYWFGTRGGGAFLFDARRAAATWHWFGSATPSVSALALHAGQLWFGSTSTGLRTGVASASLDLQRWQLYDPLAGAPARVSEFAARANQLLAAAADGVYAYDAQRWQRLSTGTAVSIAVSPHGRVFSADQASVFEAGPAGAQAIILTGGINRIRFVRDSLWVLSERAVQRFKPDGAAPETVELPSLMRRFVDAAARGDTTFLLTATALYIDRGQGWSAPVPEVATAGIGRLRTLAVTDSSVWITGDRGALRLHTGSSAVYRVPQDIPVGPVAQVIEQGRYLWFATPVGALRLESR